MTDAAVWCEGWALTDDRDENRGDAEERNFKYVLERGRTIVYVCLYLFILKRMAAVRI